MSETNRPKRLRTFWTTLITVFGPVCALAAITRLPLLSHRNESPRSGIASRAGQSEQSLPDLPQNSQLPLLLSFAVPQGAGEPQSIAVSEHWLLLIGRSAGQIVIVNIGSRRQHSLDTILKAGMRADFVPTFKRGSATGPGRDEFVITVMNPRRVVRVKMPRDDTFEPDIDTFDLPISVNTTLDVGHDEMVANGPFPDTLLTRWRSSDGRLTRVSDVGDALEPYVSSRILRALVNQSTIAQRASDHAIVQAFVFTSRLHVYKDFGRLDRIIGGPVEIRPVYGTTTDVSSPEEAPVMMPSTRYGYLDVTADDTRIYTLFSGRSFGEFKGAASLGSRIDMFGWDGEFLGSRRLLGAVSNISIGGSPNVLWAVQREPKPAVVGYLLPPAGTSSSTRSN